MDEGVYVGSGSLFDTGIPPTGVTVSWCHFPIKVAQEYDDKAMLLGSLAYDSSMTLTLHHNNYEGHIRNPELRRAKVHSFNNYYQDNEVGAQVYNGGQFYSENDILDAPYPAAYPTIAVVDGSAKVKVINPYLITSATYQEQDTGTIFNPSASYSYTLETADATLLAAIEAGVGWQDVELPQ